MAKKKVTAAEKPKKFRVRIVEDVTVKASELVPHPANWRKHTSAQRTMLRQMLEEIGYVARLIGRRLPDGRIQLIDGHLRSSESADEDVPVQIVDLTDEEADYVLARFDPIGAMAQSDREMHEQLLKQSGADPTTTSILSNIVAREQKAMQEAIDNVARQGDDPHEADQSLPTPVGQNPVDDQEDDQDYDDEELGGELMTDDELADSEDIQLTEEELAEVKEEMERLNERGVYALREDVVFPSNNKWGIPDLKADLLATTDHIPKHTWAKQTITDAARTLFLYGTNKFPPEAKGGILGFYVDDYRFETVWHDHARIVQKLIQHEWGAVIVPDFSVWFNWPMALKLFNVFRARWCARYWQEHGIRIMPGLTWDHDPDNNDWMFGTLPEYLPVVSVQCRTITRGTNPERDRAIWNRSLHIVLDRLKPEHCVIYGGTEHTDWIKKHRKTRFHYLDAWTLVRTKVRKGELT